MEQQQQTINAETLHKNMDQYQKACPHVSPWK